MKKQKLKFKKYLICPTSDDQPFENLFFVSAINEKEAIKVFANFYAHKDEFFLENLHDKSINMSFAEKFWINSENSEDFMRTGEGYNSEDDFKKNVYKYFSNKKEYADLYIDYHLSDDKNIENYKFPRDMIIYLWIKDLCSMSFRIINVDDITDIKREITIIND